MEEITAYGVLDEDYLVAQWLCELAVVVEARGEHFEQTFFDDGALNAYMCGLMAAELRRIGCNGLDKVITRLGDLLERDGLGPIEAEGCAAVLSGAMADPNRRPSPGMILREIFKTDPFSHFLPKLHALLLKNFDWKGVPQDRRYRPPCDPSDVMLYHPITAPRLRAGQSATNAVAGAFHAGFLADLRGNAAVTARVTNLVYDAVRLDAVFNSAPPGREGYCWDSARYDDPLQTHTQAWLRVRGFTTAAEQISARALRDALRHCRVPKTDPRWETAERTIDDTLDFASMGEDVRRAADSWFSQAFPWSK